MAHYLKQFDVFGSPIQLLFQQEKQVKTLMGTFLTYSVLGCLIAGLVWYGQDIVQQKRPDTLNFDRVNVNPARMNLSTSGFNLAISVTDNQKFVQFYDPSIFRYEIRNEIIRTQVNTQTGESEKIYKYQFLNFTLCKDQNFQGSPIKDFFVKSPNFAAGMVCIDNRELQNGNTFIEGDFISPIFSTLAIHIYQCRNSSNNSDSNVICKPQQKIDAVLNQAYFSVNFLDNNIDIMDPYQPVKSFGRNLFTSLSNKLIKHNLLWLRHAYVDSDFGFFFESIDQKQTIYMHQNMQERISMRKDGDMDSYFFRFQVRFQKAKESYFRRVYKQFQNLLPEIGGLLKILLIFGFLISNPISQIQIKNELINEIFNFEAISEQIESPDDKPDVFNHIQSENYINDEEIQISYMKYKNQKLIELEVINKLYHQSKTNIKLTPMEMLKNLIMPKSKEREEKKLIVNHALDQLQQRLDTVYILQKIQEIDKLQFVLLDKDQMNLFNSLPKKRINSKLLAEQRQKQKLKLTKIPILKGDSQFVGSKTQNAADFDDDDSHFIQYHNMLSEEQKYALAKQSLENFSHKSEYSSTDIKILHLIDPRISRVIKKKQLYQEKYFNIVQLKKSIQKDIELVNEDDLDELKIKNKIKEDLHMSLGVPKEPKIQQHSLFQTQDFMKVLNFTDISFPNYNNINNNNNNNFSDNICQYDSNLDKNYNSSRSFSPLDPQHEKDLKNQPIN